MTGSASSPIALNHGSRRQSAKRAITGNIAIAPSPALSMPEYPNGLGKSATRSKNGCMTCRIRRKKCDLDRAENSCNTCSSKRPDALRDPQVVKRIQADIKIHLATNHMIKGTAKGAIPLPVTDTPYVSPGGVTEEASGGGPGGVGGVGGSDFLRFDFLRRDGASGEYSTVQSPGTSAPPRKPKGRTSKAAPVEAIEGEDIDGSGEEDYEEMGQISAGDAQGAFGRHPPGFTPPYDSGHYRQRYPYPGGSPPHQGPYHPPPPHPYAQSSLRTGAYEYDPERRNFHIDESLNEYEREREQMRRNSDLGGSSLESLERSLPAYPPPFQAPAHNLLYGPGVGVASAGRSHSGYGHAGYRGPSPGITLNPSFVAPPPPFRGESFRNDPFVGPRLGMHEGRPAIPNLPPNLGPPPRMSMTQSQSSGDSDTVPFLSPGTSHTSPPAFNASPRHVLPRSSRGGPKSMSTDSPDLSAPRAPEEGDVDGEPMLPSQSSQSNPGKSTSSASAPPVMDKGLQTFPSQPSVNHHIPSGSSFGDSYTFDRTFNEADVDPSMSSALVPMQDIQGNVSLDPLTIDALLSAIGVGALSDVPNALAAQTGLVVNDPFSALGMLSMPGPTIGLTQNWMPNFGNTQIQFTTRQMELLHLWKTDLCKVQYTIAQSSDSSLADDLYELAIGSEPALYGALTLTSLYKIRLRGLQNLVPVPDDELTEVRGFKEKVAAALEDKKRTPGLINNGDAMAGLFMVSAVLFEGGTATMWNEYLQFAKMWMEHHPVVQTGSWTSGASQPSSSTSLTAPNSGPVRMDKKSAFILKTTAWFDVLGSITMRRAPYFLPTYRLLFGRQGGAGMERIMGCNEQVLLAIAETADLAKWKSEMEAKGCLSNPELCARSAAIQKNLEFVGPAYDGSGYTEDEIMGWGGSSNASQGSDDDRSSHTIRLVSNIFRATGKLYLHTVLSNCNPNVREIKDAVKETVAAFKWLQPSDVDKSLVFPIALAGCLTDEPEYRVYLSERLRALGKRGEAVGNTKSCLMLMQEVWRRRDKPGGPRIVDWIDTMKAMGWSLLLV